MTDNKVKVIFAKDCKHYILGDGTVGIGFVQRNTEEGAQRAITLSKIPKSVIGSTVTEEYKDTPVDVFLEINSIESLLVMKAVVDHAVNTLLKEEATWHHIEEGDDDQD